MTLQRLIEITGAENVTPELPTSTEVSCGYTCDLLSWVMAHGREHMAWVTVQTHMNVIAVATLHEMSCVIIPEGIRVEDAVAAKAAEEGVAMLSSPLTAYEISGRMHALGVGAR